MNRERTFRSNFASAPFTAVVSDGVFSNIYLWPISTLAPTWDKHLQSLTQQDPTSVVPTETSETLDRITCDLVHSAYFDPLTQYGVAPPVFAGEETTLPSCVQAALQNASQNMGVIQGGAIKDFVNCEESAPGPKTTQVNVIISADLKVAPAVKSTDLCTTGKSGYHSWAVGSRNFTILPTSVACHTSISAFTSTLSHEMVETLSDPAGLGWVHRTLDPETTYDDGELGDICSDVGGHPTPHVPWDDVTAGVGPLEVAPYWSNADNACVPSFMMNINLTGKTGAPIVRFTGQMHAVTLPMQVSARRDSELIEALEIALTSGDDNLNGGSDFNSNATVTLHFTSASGLGPFAITNVNFGNEWSTNSLHTVFLGVPPGITVGDLSSLTLSTNFNGNDNWNVNGITLKAAITDPQDPCQLTPLTLTDQQGSATLSDGSTGLARLSQDQSNWTVRINAGGAHANQLVSGLLLTVRTGDDDLGGGASPPDNADARITLASGAVMLVVIPFPNINTFGYWGNFTTTSVPLLALNALPANTAVGDIRAVSIHANLSGDNWDVASVTLQASAGCARTGTPPVTGTATILDLRGTTTLADGSTGLVRFTGANLPWAHDISVPAGESNATLVGLQLIITTGGDDLRGGSTDNANVVIHYASAGVGDVTYSNINQSQHWNNGETHTVALLPIPSSTTVGDIQSISIVTAFTGGSGGDNWDISRVTLIVTFQQ